MRGVRARPPAAERWSRPRRRWVRSARRRATRPTRLVGGRVRRLTEGLRFAREKRELWARWPHPLATVPFGGCRPPLRLRPTPARRWYFRLPIRRRSTRCMPLRPTRPVPLRSSWGVSRRGTHPTHAACRARRTPTTSPLGQRPRDRLFALVRASHHPAARGCVCSPAPPQVLAGARARPLSRCRHHPFFLPVPRPPSRFPAPPAPSSSPRVVAAVRRRGPLPPRPAADDDGGGRDAPGRGSR